MSPKSQWLSLETFRAIDSSSLTFSPAHHWVICNQPRCVYLPSPGPFWRHKLLCFVRNFLTYFGCLTQEKREIKLRLVNSFSTATQTVGMKYVPLLRNVHQGSVGLSPGCSCNKVGQTCPKCQGWRFGLSSQSTRQFRSGNLCAYRAEKELIALPGAIPRGLESAGEIPGA